MLGRRVGAFSWRFVGRLVGDGQGRRSRQHQQRGNQGRARAEGPENIPSQDEEGGAFRGRHPGRLIGALSALALGLVLLSPEVGAKAPGQLFDQRGVASESREGANDAMTALRQGGNAVDAAVVAALSSGVSAPGSSGLGGGGFAVLWDAAKKQATVLDFRETAPAGIEPGPFEKRPLPFEQRGRLVGVPGELRGLFDLHQRRGRKPWAELVKISEQTARRGFVVGKHLGKMLSYGKSTLAGQPAFAALYYPGGRPAVVGTRIVNAPLAATLARVAAEGPRAVYEGPIATEIVATARAAGGALTLEDLRDYRPVERQPLKTRYEGYDVYTMPPPSAGGLMLSQVLRLFSADELRRLKLGTPAYQHLIAEGMRAAVADRMRYLGDPAFEKVAVDTLLDPKRLEERRRRIALDRTHAMPRFGLEEHGTHHIATSDREGNVVSLTTTVNRLFGAKLMAEKSGIVLNDELDDFTPESSVVPFGMTKSPNRPRPGARPVSSMTPTIVVEDGRPVLAAGGSGGTAIATNVTQTVLAALVFGQSPYQALREKRIYIPTEGAFMLVEKGTPKKHIADLEWRGEIVDFMPFETTAVQMIRFDGPRVEAGADPRKHGTALAH